MTDTPSTAAGRALLDEQQPEPKPAPYPDMKGWENDRQNRLHRRAVLAQRILAIEAEARAESEEAIIELGSERDMAEAYYPTLEKHLRQHGCLHDFSEVANADGVLTDTAPAAASAKAEIEQAAVERVLVRMKQLGILTDNIRNPKAIARSLLNTPATPEGGALRFDHDGTYRHHHDSETGEPVWWENVERFGGERRRHVHWHRTAEVSQEGKER